MRYLFLTASVLTLAACGNKTAAPAPAEAPAPTTPPSTRPAQSAPASPSTAPSPSPAPNPSPAPSQTPSAAPSVSPASTPSSAPANGAAPAEAQSPTQPASANPFGNDLRNLDVAVRLREAFFPTKDRAVFDFEVKMADGSEPIKERFILLETQGVESDLLRQEAEPGYKITTYKVKPEDHERIAAAQATLMELMANSTGGNDLNFQVSVHTQIKADAEPPEDYRLKLYARSHESVDFVELGEEQIVQRSDPAGEHLFAVMPPETGQG